MRSKTGVQRDEEKRSFLGAEGRSGLLLILGPKYPLIRAGVQVLLRKMSRLEEVRGRKEFRSQMEESEQQLENLVRELKACPPPHSLLFNFAWLGLQLFLLQQKIVEFTL
jgi:hypothetical protein